MFSISLIYFPKIWKSLFSLSLWVGRKKRFCCPDVFSDRKSGKNNITTASSCIIHFRSYNISSLFKLIKLAKEYFVFSLYSISYKIISSLVLIFQEILTLETVPYTLDLKLKENVLDALEYTQLHHWHFLWRMFALLSQCGT